MWSAKRSRGLEDWSEADVLEVMAAAARIVRAGEALLVEATAQVCDRSDGRLNADRMTTRFGCRSTSELVQRATRVSKLRAADLVKAARAVVQPIALTSGEVLPAALPAMREALAAGEVGLDAVVAAAGRLLTCRAGTAAILAADEEIAASARGEGADAAPPASAEELRALATVWAMYLDQDGAEPREARALRQRGISVGPCRDGLHPVRGHVLPEVAGQLQRAFDSVLNPKVDGAVAPVGPLFRESGDGAQTVDPDDPDCAVHRDGRRPHPAAEAARRARDDPEHRRRVRRTADARRLRAHTRGVGAREDLATGRGFAHIEGSDEPISLAAARHVACSGAVQRVVFDDTGRIVALGNLERAFTHHQRRAISLRDGGCVIPGCHVGASWCEIHHDPPPRARAGRLSRRRSGATTRRPRTKTPVTMPRACP